MAKYMIHCCKDRLYYVEHYLIPSMIEQGIDKNDILKWVDKDSKGNLLSCMESFASLRKHGSTWHLQDDVMISPDFKEVTELKYAGVVCGFCSSYSSEWNPGHVFARDMWYSFPCIRIPNSLAIECANWFYNDAMHRDEYKRWVRENKYDDSFFRDFMIKFHNYDMPILNLSPNIVEHIDFLIGGSKVNPKRSQKARSSYWEHGHLTRELGKILSKDGNIK